MIDKKAFTVIPVTNVEEENVMQVRFNYKQYLNSKESLNDLRKIMFEKMEEVHYNLTDKVVDDVDETYALQYENPSLKKVYDPNMTRDTITKTQLAFLSLFGTKKDFDKLHASGIRDSLAIEDRLAVFKAQPPKIDYTKLVNESVATFTKPAKQPVSKPRVQEEMVATQTKSADKIQLYEEPSMSEIAPPTNYETFSTVSQASRVNKRMPLETESANSKNARIEKSYNSAQNKNVILVNTPINANPVTENTASSPAENQALIDQQFKESMPVESAFNNKSDQKRNTKLNSEIRSNQSSNSIIEKTPEESKKAIQFRKEKNTSDLNSYNVQAENDKNRFSPFGANSNSQVLVDRKEIKKSNIPSENKLLEEKSTQAPGIKNQESLAKAEKSNRETISKSIEKENSSAQSSQQAINESNVKTNELK
ncbi:MAG: hypothetical protein IPK03_04385 [Bacteroidetes bacterium]|nr:hypothetical protein [Bacteroidota bacterium]